MILDLIFYVLISELNGDQKFEEPHKDDDVKLLTFKAKHNPNKDTVSD